MAMLMASLMIMPTLCLHQATGAERVASAKAGRIAQRKEIPSPQTSAKKAAISVAKTSLSANPTDKEIRQLRVFLKPLVPMSGPADPMENAALSQAIAAYRQSNQTDLKQLEKFVVAHQQSRWVPALQNNIAAKKFKSGYFTEAISAYKSSWDRAKRETGFQQRQIADTAAGELLLIYCCFGRVPEVESLLAELKGRNVFAAQQKIKQAQEALHVMKHDPGIAFMCGPYALGRILHNQNAPVSVIEEVNKLASTSRGTNLQQLKELSDRVGLHFQAAKRTPKAQIITPSVIHWKVGHYGALTASSAAAGYLTQDATFAPDSDFWVTADAIDQESSGYFLIPAGPLPPGWSSVSPSEAQNVWGKGYITARMPVTGSDDPQIDPCSCQECPKPSGQGSPPQGTGGMPQVTVFTTQATERIVDVPLSYPCPVGPSMEFQANYNYLEQLPSGTTMDFCSNFGAFWKFNWVSYLEVNPTNRNVRIALRDGGLEEFYYGAISFGGYRDNVTNPYPPNPYSFAQLNVIGPDTYQRVLPDGSSEIFSKLDASYQRIFMTEVRDAQGNSATIQYDSDFRVTSITDAIGQVTTVTHWSDSVGNDGFYKIKEISVFSSPNTRTATFSYTPTTYANLLSITDAESMVSSFTYGTGAESSLIESMTTPYGTTSFDDYIPSNGGTTPHFPPRGLLITFPDSSTARVENWGDRWEGPTNQKLNYTVFWNRYNVGHWSDGYPENEDYATKTTMRSTNGFPGLTAITLIPIVVSDKPLLTDKIDYTYNQISYNPGLMRRPNSINQSGAIWQYQYNSFGHVTQSIDPIGRTFTYKYAANDIDLLEVRETKGTDYFLLGKWIFNDIHLPTKYIDGSGRATLYSYNTPSPTVPKGQLASVTDANSSVWTFTYDNRSPSTVDAFLIQTQGPLSGSADVTDFEYDAAGHLKTVTDSEGYALSYEYDKLNRPTKTTYPDGTTELTTYDKLDIDTHVDRIGRTTSYTYNTLGQLLTETDPLSRVTQYEWCTCGALKKLIDPRAKETEWAHDIAGRVTTKTFEDGTTYTYTYDSRGRLYERRDAILSTSKHITRYSYNSDNTLSQITYLLDTSPSPTQDPNTSNVSLAYDQNFKRLSTATNGWGTITYSYNPYITDPFGTATTGGGRLATVTNSVMANSTIAYAYDALGRVTERTINGSAHEIDWGYDAISRVTSETNELGQFDYTYVDNTSGSSKGLDRLASIAYPSANNQDTNFTWYPNLGDHRLQRIENLTGAGAELSRFTYGYNAAGEITQWYQRQNSTNTHRTTGYDLASQLTSAPTDSGANTTVTVTGTQTNGDVLTITVLDYGLSGGQKVKNYTVVSGDTTPTIAAASITTAINADTDLSGIGVTATSSSGVITLASSSTRATQFDVGVSANSTYLLALANPTAKTPLGTDLTYTYDTGSNRTTEVVGGSTTTFNYNDVNALTSITGGATLTWDKNGNMTSDGTNTYAWDAENRLLTITYSTGATTLFTYDPLGRCAKIEETGSTPTYPGNAIKQFVWCGNERCEERDSGGSTVTKQFFSRGQRNGSTNYFYTLDHLGSIREMTNSSATIVYQQSFDPYGKATNIVNTTPADFGYAGMYLHSRSGMNLTPFRAYKSDLGRWISRDPIGERVSKPELPLLELFFAYSDENLDLNSDARGFSFLNLANSVNLYAYIDNAPILCVDRFGLFPRGPVTWPFGKGPFGPYVYCQEGCLKNPCPNCIPNCLDWINRQRHPERMPHVVPPSGVPNPAGGAT